MENIKELTFSYNWNNKLNCKSFSTVRIENPKKYILLDEYRVILKTKGDKANIDKGIARLQHISHFYLHSVNPGISFIDANLPVLDFQKLLLTLYKNSGINFNLVRLSFLVFQYIPITNPEKEQAAALFPEV